MGRIWDAYLSERDRRVYEAAGYGGKMGFGTRPALIVIDVQYSFLGDEPMDIVEAIGQYRTACGEAGWKAVHAIEELLQVCRDTMPIFYTVSERRKDLFDSGVQRHKNFRHKETSVAGSKGTQVPDSIAPREKDIMIRKPKPSAFFGSPLMSYLNQLRVDTLIVAGSTTSGCVRATVQDSFAYNFHTVVVEECTFDRFDLSHAVNLFDINTKYADVLPLGEVKAWVEEMGRGRNA